MGLVPIRKAGKLPNIKRNVARQRFVDYTGEVGGFEINKTLISPGDRILLVDDWVETGGQLRGLTKLLEKRGAVVSDISVLGFNAAEHQANYEMLYRWRVFWTTTPRPNAI